MLLRALALVSIEAILFANIFFVQFIGGHPGIESSDRVIIWIVFSLPTLLILLSALRTDKMIFGRALAYLSGLFILVPLGISSLVVEKMYPNYYEIRGYVLVLLFCLALYVVKRF